MSKKLTPWFYADTEPPVRVGAYIAEDGRYYSWFQNGRFHGCWGSPSDAKDAFAKHGKKHAKTPMGGWTQITRWRGLMEKPQ